VIDPVSSGSSITHQTKKRPLEDDTATTGAYLQLVLHTRLSILDLFFILFALYALNTDKKNKLPYPFIYQYMLETDRTTWREQLIICFDACLFDFFAFIQICFLWFGQFLAYKVFHHL
jgi:hypothetical protein